MDKKSRIRPAEECSVDPSDDIKGSLGTVIFPHLLHHLYTLKATGLLHLERGEVCKTVYFQRGYPIFVRSNLVRECLGKLLVREGVISAGECGLSLEKMKESGQLQGTVLMEMGLLSPHEVHDALRRQAMEKLLEIFSWREGTYRFLPASNFRQGVTAIELSPAALILQGIRKFWLASEVDQFLAPFRESYPAPVANPHLRFQNMELTGREDHFLGRCQGQATLGELLDQHPASRLEFSQLLAALLMTRMVEALDKPTSEKTCAESDPPHPRNPATLREAILADYERMMEQDHFALLGIGREADAGEIRRSYFNLAKRYHPDRFIPDHLSAELQDKVQQIFRRLNESYETLSDPVARKNYLCAQDQQGSRERRTVAENLLQAEVAFRKGQILLRKSDFSGALTFLQPALELNPEEPEYLTSCAWAKYRAHPQDQVTAAEAREMLLRSLDINRGLDLTHLYLGYLLREDGREAEAQRHFEMAVMCNPDCVAALRELRLINLRKEQNASPESRWRRWFSK